ncbi:MAG: hypothetical protein D6801_06725, partial [Alphaproteobacteria bacterium]
NVSFLALIERVVERCAEAGTPLSFCGEDAGRPVEAVTLAALGLRDLSMRPASIGPVKSLIRRTNLCALRDAIEAARAEGAQSVRPAVTAFLKAQGEGRGARPHEPRSDAAAPPTPGFTTP